MSEPAELETPPKTPRSHIDDYDLACQPYRNAQFATSMHLRGNRSQIPEVEWQHWITENPAPSDEELEGMMLADTLNQQDLAAKLGIPIEYLPDLLLAYDRVKSAESDAERLGPDQTPLGILDVRPGMYGSKDPALVVYDVYNGLVTLARLTDSKFALTSDRVYEIDPESDYAFGDPSKPYWD